MASHPKSRSSSCSAWLSGGLFLLHVQVQPGNGSIYTGISPFVGVSTQQSEQDAVDYAFYSSGMNLSQCDVFFSMIGDFGPTNSVDGPSAGTAMALATKAALLNETLRPDIAVTGTIDQSGTIGDVGGVLEKSLAAYNAGESYILVPSMALSDSFILSSETDNLTFQAIVVTNFSQAERMITSDPSAKFYSNFTPEAQPLPYLPRIAYDTDLGKFSALSQKVVDNLQQQTSSLEGQQSLPDSLKGYFSGEIANYNKLLALGYPYAAANSAFLLSIDVQYIKLGGRNMDLDQTFSDTQQCVSTLSSPQKTRENFQWAVGSDLRRIWANSELNETITDRSGETDEGYSLLQNLLYSQSWCGISSDLASEANSLGGEPVNESLLSSLASTKISGAEEVFNETGTPDYDALWHLQNAYIAQRQGDYGAAIFEATYASTMQQAEDSPPGNYTIAIQNLTLYQPTSLWGKIYYGQGVFLAATAQNDSSVDQSAYSILLYAQNLDAVTNEMDSTLGAGTPQTQQNVAGEIVSAAILVYVALLVGLVVYRLEKRRKH